MTTYRISSVWKDANNVITHYAFHTDDQNSTGRAVKKSKTSAISLLESPGNTATTWVWNYEAGRWDIGEKVQIVNGVNGNI